MTETHQTTRLRAVGPGNIHLPGERLLVNPWAGESREEVPLPHRSTLRPVRICHGIAGEGSIYLEWGSGADIVKLIASVRGPRQQAVSRSKFEVEVSFAAFASLVFEASEFERDLAQFVKEAIEGFVMMEEYPFSALSVELKILECGSSLTCLISPAITAASLACSKAGIQMQDEVVSVTLGVTPSGELLVDPEDRFAPLIPCCTIAMGTKSRRISFMHTSGVLKATDVLESMMAAADRLTEILRSQIEIN